MPAGKATAPVRRSWATVVAGIIELRPMSSAPANLHGDATGGSGYELDQQLDGATCSGDSSLADRAVLTAGRRTDASRRRRDAPSSMGILRTR